MTGLEATVELVKVFGAVLVALLGAGGAVHLILKRFPPRATSLANEITKLKDEARELKEEQAVVRQDMRDLTDYVHDLREHIAAGKPPPPPDWPKGLRL